MFCFCLNTHSKSPFITDIRCVPDIQAHQEFRSDLNNKQFHSVYHRCQTLSNISDQLSADNRNPIALTPPLSYNNDKVFAAPRPPPNPLIIRCSFPGLAASARQQRNASAAQQSTEPTIKHCNDSRIQGSND